MSGIDLNRNLVYKFASFRYFERGEHHVSRFCLDNVLLLVFGGVLRFSEDGEEIEVRAGILNGSDGSHCTVGSQQCSECSRDVISDGVVSAQQE